MTDRDALIEKARAMASDIDTYAGILEHSMSARRVLRETIEGLISLASPSPAQWPEDVVERAAFRGLKWDENPQLCADILAGSGSIYMRERLACACAGARAALATLPPPETFQARVAPWMAECFGPEISADKVELNDRFIEEALELVQASGYTAERAHALVDYTFNRPQGEINQEVGGVMVTLAAHCLGHGVDMHEAAETELARIWTKVEQIRAKQAAKPKHSASAIPVPLPPPEDERVKGLVEALEETLAIAELFVPVPLSAGGFKRARSALASYRGGA